MRSDKREGDGGEEGGGGDKMLYTIVYMRSV